jgi:hypothetical protein
MAKRRKNRTHTKGANEEVAEDKGPKSFVIKVCPAAAVAVRAPLLTQLSLVGRSDTKRVAARQGHAKGHGTRNRQSSTSESRRFQIRIPF